MTIELDGVTFTYEHAAEPALSDVSCRIEDGSFVGVTGPTDAGKTTLCRLLPGFVPHFFGGDLDGAIDVRGVDVPESSIGALGDAVGFVFESPADQLTGAATTVLEEVAFGLEQRGVPRDEIERRARERLTEVGVADLADRDPQSLSGGQLQRVAVASVLALDPEVLVLDEPTSQLDPDGTRELFDAVSRMHEAGYTVVLVSHDLQRLAPRADRLLVLEEGRLRADGAPREVLADAALDGTVATPPTVRLGRGLRADGVVPADEPLPLTVQAAAEELRAHATIDGADLPDGGSDSTPAAAGSPSTAGDPRVRLDGVEHVYEGGVEALTDVDLTLDAGCVALLGHNGSGKTTLAKHLNGLLEPTAGRVSVAGADTREQSVADLATHVGLAFQNPDEQLFRPTVRAEVAFGPENLGRDADRAVEAAVEALDLGEVIDESTYELGRAVRKRVAVASVVAMGTDVVVLDEPTGGQDPAGRAVIGRLVDDLVAEGRLVVPITHDVEFAREHADRIVALADGRVVADGPPAAVFGNAEVLDRAGLDPPVAVAVAAELGLSGAPTVADLRAAARPDD